MKKIFFTLFFLLTFYNTGFAQSYYFKECKLSEKLLGDYLIDIDKYLINVTLKSTDGTVQQYVDKIKLITNDSIISEIIPKKDTKFSTQYFLDVSSKSVIRQLYKREGLYGLIKPEGAKIRGNCKNVKSDWAKTKEEEEKEKASEEIQILEQRLLTKSSLPKCQKSDLQQRTNCVGTYLGSDDYIYVGEWKDNKQHGEGIEIWKDGKKYVGEFRNDKWHGQGTLTLSDGTKFTGQYKNGKKHGQGTTILSNGDKYVGKFKNDKPHGQGTYTFTSGTIYSGQYTDGKMLEGTITYVEGEKYVGEFEFDKPHGQGTITYSNGGKFIGQFIDGVEYGEGICIKPDGSKIECQIESRDIYLGKNKYSISIIGGWHVFKKQIEFREQLKNDFDEKAYKFCLTTGDGNFDALEKKIEIKETDETPAFGLETKYKLGIDGIIKCS